ncbi:MAG: class I SAM-dependent methyltransferase, partial [Alistipes sp.]|nr:class I SAM-dependent methyltransferase [Alistipes sp.]
CAALGLTNVTPVNARVESLPQKFDYVVSRAVTDMKTFTGWIWNKIERGQRGTLPNGILYLKGGDLAEELALTGKRWDLHSISSFYDEDFFDTKKVVYTKR